jgi:ABC-type lipoprotein export system ATPase subunit/CRP-like cAMP-binding protein
MKHLNFLNKFSHSPAKQTSLTPQPVSSLPASANQPLIDLRHVVKTYHTPAGAFTALKNVDLQVQGGEFVAVIGKSGSGKSTLINMVTGIDRPTLGQVWVSHLPIHNLNEDQMALWRGQNLGVIFQFFQLLPTLTLLENVVLPMQLSGQASRAERIERAHHLLGLVDLADQAHKFPASVSGGQQQRVAIARALANNPKVLVADEPTGSLDSRTADSIFQLFEDFVSQGRTILMVTHDRDLASRVSRVVLIADGEIVDQRVSQALPTLNKKQLVEISSRLEPLINAPGTTIFRQGDPADKFYIIVKGQVEIVIWHESGQEIISATLGTGQYFGEAGLLEDGIRNATARVTPDSEVILLGLDREMFNKLVVDSQLTHDAIASLMRQRTTTNQLMRVMPDLSQAYAPQLHADYERLTYRPGEIIIKKGDLADKFYLIAKGAVEVMSPHDEALPLARLSSGQHFGEMGLVQGRQRMNTIRAAVDLDIDAEVIGIGRETFHKLSTETKLTKDEIAVIMHQRLAASLQEFMPDLQRRPRRADMLSGLFGDDD